MIRNSLLAIAVLALLSGCGGGGGGKGGGLVTAKGRVQLPAGTNLSLASLQVASPAGTSPVAADGSFAVPEASKSPGIIDLTDPAGNVVMLGLSNTPAGTGEISARTTAQVLLFYALGAEFLPPDEFQPALDMIGASNETATLAGVVGQAIAANPTAITTGDPQIDSALQTAATSIVPGRAAAPGRSVPAKDKPAALSRAQVAVSRSRDASVGQIIIQPSRELSGATVLQNPDGDGIVVMNTLRRHCQFFIFKTGTTDANGVKTDFPLVQPLGGAHDLPSVVKVNGFFGSLDDWIHNKIAYGPVTSDPVSLPLDPGATETRYELVLVGYSVDVTLPAVFADPRYAQVEPGLQTAADDLAMDAFVRDFLMNIVLTELMAPKDVLNVLGDKTMSSTLIEDLIKLFKSAPGVLDKLKAGHVYDALEAAGFAIANSSGFRRRIVESIAGLDPSGVFNKQLKNADTVLTRFKRLNTFLKALELSLSLGDIAKMVHDFANSHTAEVWSIKVEAPHVHLDPAIATVTVNNNIILLTARVVGVNVADVRYVWTTSGTQGHLEDAHNPTPLPTGPIPNSEAAYVADLLKLTAGRSDTVTVNVVLASDPNTSLGSATSTITGGTDLACGPPPAGIVNGNAAPTLVLNGTSFHTGDILSATIQIGANISGSWDLELWNNDSRKPVIADVLTLDGAPPPIATVRSRNGVVSISLNINPQGAPETHTVTFRMRTPLDLNGQPETMCAGGPTSEGTVGPYVIADIFTSNAGSPSRTVFFNAGP